LHSTRVCTRMPSSTSRYDSITTTPTTPTTLFTFYCPPNFPSPPLTPDTHTITLTQPQYTAYSLPTSHHPNNCHCFPPFPSKCTTHQLPSSSFLSLSLSLPLSYFSSYCKQNTKQTGTEIKKRGGRAREGERNPNAGRCFFSSSLIIGNCPIVYCQDKNSQFHFQNTQVLFLVSRLIPCFPRHTCLSLPLANCRFSKDPLQHWCRPCHPGRL
jgi:hypothetical protein